MRRRINVPALIVALLGGTLTSILGGFLIASFVVGDTLPAHAADVPQARRSTLDRDPSTELTTVERIAASSRSATPTTNDW